MSDDKKSTAFSDKERSDDSGKRDVLFNRGESDGDKHGHVVTSNDNQTTHYARDEDQNEYVDDSKD